MIFLRHSILWILLILCIGCAGAQKKMTFEHLQYPASTSAYLYDSDGRKITFPELESITELNVKDRVWGFFWSNASTKGKDVDKLINEQIALADGVGVVNVTVVSKPCAVNGVPIIHLIPFVPGCTKITLHGQIVKKSKNPPPRPTEKKTAAAPASSTPHIIGATNHINNQLDTNCTVKHFERISSANLESDAIETAKRVDANIIQVIGQSSHTYSESTITIRSGTAQIRFWKCETNLFSL